MKKERVIVVSSQKSGTHLVCELMVQLGYRTFGWIVMDDKPEFTAAETRAMAKSVMQKHKRLIYSLGRPFGLFKTAEQNALNLLALLWGERLAAPWLSRHGIGAVHEIYSRPNLAHLGTKDITSTPKNICVVKHELPLEKMDGQFLRYWSKTGEPSLIFMYRDPRDVLCSFVRYLTGRTNQERHGGFADYHIYQSILQNLPNDDERLMHAILDPSFPGHREYSESLWLLRHPNVCKVSYEELVGSAGGGSVAAERGAVSRVLQHLDIDGDPAEYAREIYNTGSFSFSKGTIGSWREMFKPHHHKIFNDRYGYLLGWYGYEEFAP